MAKAKPTIRERVNLSGSTSYCVDAGKIRGERYRKFFPTRQAAQDHAAQLKQTLKDEGEKAFSLSLEQRVEAQRAYEKLSGSGVTLSEAVEYYLKHAQPKSGKRLIKEVVDELLAFKKKKGGKPRSIKALRYFYTDFNTAFGGR